MVLRVKVLSEVLRSGFYSLSQKRGWDGIVNPSFSKYECEISKEVTHHSDRELKRSNVGSYLDRSGSRLFSSSVVYDKFNRYICRRVRDSKVLVWVGFQ